MIKRISINNKLISLTCLFLLIFVMISYVILNFAVKDNSMRGIIITEPLLMENVPGDDGYYVLPAGTVLYHDKSFPEGHDRYIVYFNHKGSISHEKIYADQDHDGITISPVWLTSMDKETLSTTETYSQEILLKNWALSICLAAIAANEQDRNDANATASAYLEFGKQQTEAYDSLRSLAKQYASKKYGSSVGSELNTMKCIDLFHSHELNSLVQKILKDPSLNTHP